MLGVKPASPALVPETMRVLEDRQIRQVLAGHGLHLLINRLALFLIDRRRPFLKQRIDLLAVVLGRVLPCPALGADRAAGEEVAWRQGQARS